MSWFGSIWHWIGSAVVAGYQKKVIKPRSTAVVEAQTHPRENVRASQAKRQRLFGAFRFHKIGVPPVIIHLSMDFPWNKPSIFGIPPWLWKPSYPPIDIPFFITTLSLHDFTQQGSANHFAGWKTPCFAGEKHHWCLLLQSPFLRVTSPFLLV